MKHWLFERSVFKMLFKVIKRDELPDVAWNRITH